MSAASSAIVNAMTVDVEDYFHVSAFDGVVPRSQWAALESRVCANTQRFKIPAVFTIMLHGKRSP